MVTRRLGKSGASLGADRLDQADATTAIAALRSKPARFPPSDLLLASRLGDGSLQINLPLSASLRGEIGPNGVPQSLTGRIVADAGYISDGNGADGRVDIDRAEFKINWDAGSRVLSVPFQILSGGNRITLLGQVEAPAQARRALAVQDRRRHRRAAIRPATQGDPLILNRIAVSGQFDPVKKRFAVDHGDIGNGDVGVAMSGNADYSGGDLHLAAGVAGDAHVGRCA